MSEQYFRVINTNFFDDYRSNICFHQRDKNYRSKKFRALKINALMGTKPKFIIDFQNGNTWTFSIYLFATSRNLLVWCVSAKENYCNLTKNVLNFRQVSLKRVLLSGSEEFFKSTSDKVESLKIHYCT